MELCKKIPGYAGFLASNTGKIYRCAKTVKCRGGATRNMPGKVLSERMCAKGYSFVRLTVNGKTKSPKVHRLVATTWLKNPQGKKTINHKDGNKQNNHITNLEFMTHAENMAHAWEIGLCKGLFGTDNPNSILTDHEIAWAKDMVLIGCMQQEIARELNVSRQTIYRITK